MSKSVAVLIKDRDRQYEGLRTSLGLLMEFHTVTMIVLDHEINMTEEYQDNMEFLDEMEGDRYSNNKTNVDKHEFKPIADNDLISVLKNNEIIIPY